MAVVTFPARNKYAYPTGYRASVDPSHPASQNLAMSAVSSGAKFYDLLRGAIPTDTLGTPPVTAVFDGAIGPSALNGNASNTPGAIFPGTVAVPTSCTFAVIARPIATVTNHYNSLVVTAGGYLFFLKDGVLNTYTNSDNLSGITVTYGDPYFLAFSGSLVSGGIGNYVATNLKTGQILQSSVTIASTFSADSLATIYIGRNNGGSYSVCNLAAAMCSPNLALSMPQLRAFAEDPWAFWYPNRARNRIAAAAVGGSFLAAWANQTNLPVLGTGTY